MKVKKDERNNLLTFDHTNDFKIINGRRGCGKSAQLILEAKLKNAIIITARKSDYIKYLAKQIGVEVEAYSVAEYKRKIEKDEEFRKQSRPLVIDDLQIVLSKLLHKVPVACTESCEVTILGGGVDIL